MPPATTTLLSGIWEDGLSIEIVDTFRAWMTLFVSTALQAAPFLVAGVVLSTVVATAARHERFRARITQRSVLVVPIAAAAGALLPGCECGSVPLANRLVRSGLRPGAALAFMVSSPAINPIVIVATATAFPGRPGFVIARFAASLAASIAIGIVWDLRHGWEWPTTGTDHHDHGSGWRNAADLAGHDLVHAGGWLIVGAAIAATSRVLLPDWPPPGLAGGSLTGPLTMAALAILLSICSEADAFAAAAMPQVPLAARLTFLVVGPAIDLKLIAIQRATLGLAVVRILAPLTVAVTVACSMIAGAWL